MSSIIALACLLFTVANPAILNIFAYPVSHKWSMAISDYIVKVCAHRLFSVLHLYKHFNYWGYTETKELLPENFIVISNHQSLLDIPAFFNFFRDRDVRFVAKDTLSRHVPLVSEMLRTQKHCMIPRKAKPMDAMRYLEGFGKQVNEMNQIPLIFPEGSRTRNGDVGKFYSAGLRKLSESSGLPVAVCALDGGWKLRDIRKIMTNLKYGCYRVKVLKVYPNPQTKEECQQILDEGKELIQAQLNEWRALTPDVK